MDQACRTTRTSPPTSMPGRCGRRPCFARSAASLDVLSGGRESYCRVVTTHHTIEDTAMFPRLVHADASLAPVVDVDGVRHRSDGHTTGPSGRLTRYGPGRRPRVPVRAVARRRAGPAGRTAART